MPTDKKVNMQQFYFNRKQSFVERINKYIQSYANLQET